MRERIDENIEFEEFNPDLLASPYLDSLHPIYAEIVLFA